MTTQERSRLFPVDNHGYLDEAAANTFREDEDEQLGISASSQPLENQREHDQEDSEDLQTPQGQDTDADLDFDLHMEEFWRDLRVLLLTLALPVIARQIGRRFSLWAWTSYVQWYYKPRAPEERDVRQRIRQSSP
ncbi:hypothetical protein G9A89_010522 [Geosiphon pyriformis]|nr:hypothetical protein G9A89_010522 [Geosiphon pyriformis]